MNQRNYETISQAINDLTANGYNEDFEAKENRILGNYSRKEYLPTELKIVDFYRFEGMTDPDDEAVVFAVEAIDGTKGTLVMSLSFDHNQNTDLINEIPIVKS